MEELVNGTKENVQCLVNEWEQIKLALKEEHQTRGQVTVSERELHNLQLEISAAKEMLYKFKPEVSMFVNNSRELYEALANSNSSLEENQQNQEHLQSRCEALKSECDQERKRKLMMQAELSEVSNQLSLQSEYCASMGAVCCTLLWRASQQEHMIPHLLAGSQMKSFLPVVSHTVESFLAATYEDVSLDGMNEEMQFVLALVGTITNVAASAVGREFLAKSSSCQALIKTFKSLLLKRPSKHLVRLKGLAIMALYNLSINQTGLKTLASTKGLVSLLTWLLSAEISGEMRLHTLLLLHSLVLEQKHISLLLEVREGVTDQLIEELSNHRDKDIREVFVEIMQAVRTAEMEQ